jgi:hypothetical protein
MSVIAFTSAFTNQSVLLDPWAANPLLDDAKAVAGPTVALARATGGDPPTMFSTGDLPLFLASGVDPRFLNVLPWRTRHAAAMNPDATTVLGYIEDYANDPDASLPSPGLAEYICRFHDWLAGRWVNPNFAGADPDQTAGAEDAFYSALFGATNALRQAQLDQVNASAHEFRADN